MSGKRNRSSRNAALVAAAAALSSIAGASPALGQTASSWVTPASGTWTDGTRWSTSPNYPDNGTPVGTTYDATIAATGSPYTVGLSSNVTVSSFTLNSADAILAQTGAVFDAGGVTLSAGAYQGSGGATLRASSITGAGHIDVLGNFTLDVGTLGVDVIGGAGSALTLAGAWSNSGAVAISDGSLTIAATPVTVGNVSLTNSTLRIASVVSTAQVNAISLSNSNVSVLSGGVNNTAATISLAPGAPTWTLAGGAIAGGNITSSGGAKLLLAPGTTSGIQGLTLGAGIDVPAGTTLRLSSGLTNTGTITVGAGGTVQLVGSPQTQALGNIVNTAGGSVQIVQALNNAGATLNLNAATGPWTLVPGGSIGNGTVTGTSPNNLVALGGTLTGVTVAGEVSVGDTTATGVSLVLSTVTMSPGGRFTVLPAPSSTAGVTFQGATLAGTGEVVFDGASDGGFVRPEITGTFAPGITVRTGTRGGTVGGAGIVSVNRGLISAQTAGRTLTVQGTLNNQGAVEARNGSTLAITGPVTQVSGTTLNGGAWAVYDTASLTLPGGTSITNNAATVTLSGSGSSFAALNGLATNSGTLNIAGGKLFTTAGNLTNSGAVSVGTGSALKVVGMLANTGKVDLAGGTLVLDYTGASSADVLRQQLLTGRAGGSWNAATGVVSSTAAADAQQRLGVGYAEAADLGVSTWANVGVDSTAVVTKITYYGDANLDGRVNSDDFALADRGLAKGLTGWVNGDFDYSGAITSADFLLMDRVYLQQGGVLTPDLLATRQDQFGPTYAAQLVALPEPGVALLAAAGLPLAMRRRRV